MPGLALAVDILARDRASGTLRKVGDETERTHKKFSVLGAGLAGGAIGAGIAAFGKKAVEAAVEGEGAHARLAQAIKNTGGNVEELEPQIDKLSGKFAKLGYTNDEVEKALGTLTTSLHDPKKAMDSLGIAADLAATKHVDLDTASLAVGKAMEGNLRPLKQLGIDLPVAAGGALKLEQAHTALAKAQDAVQSVLEKYPNAAKAGAKGNEQYQRAILKVQAAQDKVNQVQDAGHKITAALAKAVGGQASAAAGTYAGKVQAMHVQFENFQEQVGQKVLPVLLKLMTHLQTMGSFIERNQRVIKPLAVILGTLAGTVFLVSKAIKVWAAVQKILDLELAANPIGIVILAIAGLAAGLIYAYKHSETFRKIVNGALSGIASAAKAMWGVIRPILKAWADAWLFVLGTLIHGAAKAFGWVPGIGPKLKSAAKEFDKFKSAVNNSLDGITPTKTVTIKMVSSGVAEKAANAGIHSGALSGSEAAASVTSRSGTSVHVTVHNTVDERGITSTVSRQTTKNTQRGHLNPGLA